MLKAILFDLDGTLFDSLGLLLSGYKHAVREHLGIETRDEDWLPLIGLPLHEQMEHFSKEHAVELVSTYRGYYAKHHDKLLRIYPGAKEAVRELNRLGFLLAIVTSKKTLFANRGLEHFGISQYFQAVVGEDEVMNHKPAPDPILCALDKLSVLPDEAIMIGDAPSDILSARAAGVRSAAALWGACSRKQLADVKPDFMLEQIEEIVPLAVNYRDANPKS